MISKSQHNLSILAFMVMALAFCNIWFDLHDFEILVNTAQTAKNYDELYAIKSGYFSSLSYCTVPEIMNLNCTSCSFIDPNYKPINVTETYLGWGYQAFAVLKND